MLCLAAVTAVVERLEANMPNAVFDMVRVGRGMIVFWETIAPSNACELHRFRRPIGAGFCSPLVFGLRLLRFNFISSHPLHSTSPSSDEDAPSTC